MEPQDRECRLPHSFKITVCDRCRRACCWQGDFMCDEARDAGIMELTVAELQSGDFGEHWSYWSR